uniref:Uncharacterized protein C7orf57-like n=1 Tax=Phallusia mammillata TaxID=59560 RepID=A0A6F9D8A6_9ASCI|nr:uncharacterized protein C7orf57-like [Phallusia mammillata]
MQSKGGGQEWYYHAPASKKKGEKQPAPPASQIPLLSAPDELDIEAMQRETGTNKLNWIRDTDSKYIQLAKQGGRKNLLTFNAQYDKDDGPRPYPRVDWFDHAPMSVEEEKKILAERRWNPPEYMVHEPYMEEAEKVSEPVKVDLGAAIKERRNIQDKYENRQAPFYVDSMSPDKVQAEGPDRLKLPEIRQKQSQGIKREVEFDKLLSGGYGTEWIKSHNQATKKPGKKFKEPNHKGWLNLTEYQQAISKKEQPRRKLKPIAYQPKKTRVVAEEKEPFKMSKFSKVKTKLSTGAVLT